MSRRAKRALGQLALLGLSCLFFTVVGLGLTGYGITSGHIVVVFGTAVTLLACWGWILFWYDLKAFVVEVRYERRRRHRLGSLT